MPLTNSYLTTILLHMLWHSGELLILAPLALLFSLIRLAPYGIFVLGFTSCMWNWVRCGSLLIYVVIDNQTEKLKITSTTHLNRDFDIYAEECKLKKYGPNVGHLSRPQCVDFCVGRVCYKNHYTNLQSPLAMLCQFEEQSHNSSI